jgi:hypothetical protein
MREESLPKDKGGKIIRPGDVLGFGDGSGIYGTVAFGTERLFCGFDGEEMEYNVYKTLTCLYIKERNEPLYDSENYIIIKSI